MTTRYALTVFIAALSTGQHPRLAMRCGRGNILVVETETKDRIALFPPGHKFKSASITFRPGYGSILTQLAIKADEKELFASAIDGAVFTTAYPFPQSGTLSALLKADASLQGMALSSGQTF
jgi:hypothetical protein